MPDASRRSHFDMQPVGSRAHPRVAARAVSGRADVRTFARTRPTSAAMRLPRVSPVALVLTLVATLGVVYIALIAVVMSYAAMTVSFSQQVRSDEADVAALESQYLSRVAAITNVDYQAEGYDKPTALVYVPTARATALR